jgi:ABC-2 type transport system permease protein
VLLGGKIASVFGLAVLETGILVGFGALVLDVPWGHDPLALLMVLVPYLLAATGIGVLISALVRSRAQLSGLMPLVAKGLAMIGGCYWQLEIMPPFMQTLARLTPTGWTMIGLTDVVARNQGVQAALVPAAVLLAMATVFFGLGVWRLRLE